MSINELEQKRVEIETDIAKIRAQLEMAKAQVHTSGVYADPLWFRRAQTALRFKGIEHQNVLRQIGELRRSKRQEDHRSREHLFIEVAKRKLSREMFDLILQEVRRMETEHGT